MEVLAHNADIMVGTRKQETVAKSITVLCNPSTFPVITGRNVFTKIQFSKLKGTQVRQSEMRSVVVPSRSPSKPIRSLKRKQIKIQKPTIFIKGRSLYFRVTDSKWMSQQWMSTCSSKKDHAKPHFLLNFIVQK